MANLRVAINGSGRIGGATLEVLLNRKGVDVVAINDRLPIGHIVPQLEFDSVRGCFPGRVEAKGDNTLLVNGQEVVYPQQSDPSDLPWGDLGIDVVVEATGVFKTREACQKHIDAGAQRVVLTVPPEGDVDSMVVRGVNDGVLRPEHRIVSNASCTTNCLAPIVKVLDDNFGVEWGAMSTTHAYTNDQRLHDAPHSDPRRGYAAAQNIIYTSTGAARAVGKVLPHLNGKLDGSSFRVPVINGSVIFLVTELENPPLGDVDQKKAAICEAMRRASQKEMEGILQFSNEPLVSGRILKRPFSSIFDAGAITVMPTGQIMIVAWYDNEWGYSNRLADLVERLGALMPA